jgi:phenylalanyl-tRNA synthetase beta chain
VLHRIEDGSGKLIDLCGIMGGENSAIDKDTKNVLLFVQTYNQHKIRKTSMTLAQRSEAAVLFEKGLDPENVKPSILTAIEMIEKLSGGVAEKEILDIYKNPYKQKFVNTTLETLEKIVGIKLNKKEISTYLESLGFSALWNGNNLKVGVPSYRSDDVNIPEDLAEEIARIYGYHNLPNILMAGNLPQAKNNSSFEIENVIKFILKSLGAQEVLNLSLIDKDRAGNNALRLKNPLGSDTEYLRTSLKPYLIENVKNNAFEKNKIHFFELSNIYLARKNDLPEEWLMLSGIIKNGEYRKNSGVVATLLDELQIDYQVKVDDQNGYLPGQEISIYSNKIKIGEYGNLEEGYFYYEFEIANLLNAKRLDRKFKEVSKFPPQIEDITFELPEKTYVGDVVDKIKSVSSLITKVELKDIFKNNYTFNIEYHNPEKTMTDDEVAKIHERIIKAISQ